MDISPQLIEDVEVFAPGLISLPGVTGVGLGFREENEEFFDELAVRVLVADASEVPAGIPEEIAGVTVCVVEFPVEPLFAPDTTRYQELLGGAQIQQAPLASGTLGSIVQDADGVLVGLTCHHVAGDPGTTVWQPIAPLAIAGAGPPDPTDSIGEVVARESPATQTIPVPAGPLLLLGREIDAATVGLEEAVNQGRTISEEIADGFGAVDSTSSPNVGMFVKKRGSQTRPTSGQVVGIQLMVPWLFGQPPRITPTSCLVNTRSSTTQSGARMESSPREGTPARWCSRTAPIRLSACSGVVSQPVAYGPSCATLRRLRNGSA